MRAVIRLRSDINANIEVKDTLVHLRLNRINHCVLVPEGDTYDGMLQKVKDYVTWGELKPEVLTNMMIKRGMLTGKRKLDNKYVKENTKSESMIKYAESIIAGKEIYADLKDVQPVFRLHPPLKGHRAIKKSFRAGGDLGYRGDDINNLILKMLGPEPIPKSPEKKAAPKKTSKKPVSTAAKKPAAKKKESSATSSNGKKGTASSTKGKKEPGTKKEVKK